MKTFRLISYLFQGCSKLKAKGLPYDKVTAMERYTNAPGKHLQLTKTNELRFEIKPEDYQYFWYCPNHDDGHPDHFDIGSTMWSYADLAQYGMPSCPVCDTNMVCILCPEPEFDADDYPYDDEP